MLEFVKKAQKRLQEEVKDGELGPYGNTPGSDDWKLELCKALIEANGVIHFYADAAKYEEKLDPISSIINPTYYSVVGDEGGEVARGWVKRWESLAKELNNLL